MLGVELPCMSSSASTQLHLRPTKTICVCACIRGLPVTELHEHKQTAVSPDRQCASVAGAYLGYEKSLDVRCSLSLSALDAAALEPLTLVVPSGPIHYEHNTAV